MTTSNFSQILSVKNPFSSGNFAGKCVLKLVERFSGHFHAIYRLYTSRPSDPDAKYYMQLAQKAKFHFLSSPLFNAFLASFFPFAGHLVGFILVGKVFRKAVRILGLDERKGRWVVEQDFHEDFQGYVTCFVLSFSSVLLTEMCSFWYA